MRRSYKFLVFLFLAPPLLLAGVVLWTARQLDIEAEEVARSTDVVRATTGTLQLLTDAETGERGYFITDDPAYLEPYERAVRELPGELDSMDALSKSTPDLAKAVQRIREVAGLKLEHMGRVIEAERMGDEGHALALLKNGDGKVYMDELRTELTRINESSLSALQENRATENNLGSLFLILAGASLVLTGVGLLMLYRVGAAEEAAKAEVRAASLIEANQNLEDFARVAAHDLRAPARTAVSMLQLGRRKLGSAAAPEAEEMFNRVENALRRQLKLIEDLMGYQHLGQEELPQASAVDLNQTLREAIANLQETIKDTDAKIEVGPLPTVRGHESQAIQLFQNLLENAIKYRDPNRTPEIRVTADAPRGKGQSWLIRVRDNGLGFDPSSAERIFRPFARAHGSSHPGSGVGLASCAKIVERAGGRIWAETEPGEGSVFCISLPVA